MESGHCFQPSLDAIPLFSGLLWLLGVRGALHCSLSVPSSQCKWEGWDGGPEAFNPPWCLPQPGEEAPCNTRVYRSAGGLAIWNEDAVRLRAAGVGCGPGRILARPLGARREGSCPVQRDSQETPLTARSLIFPGKVSWHTCPASYSAENSHIGGHWVEGGGSYTATFTHTLAVSPARAHCLCVVTCLVFRLIASQSQE